MEGKSFMCVKFNQFQTKIWGKLQILIYRLKTKGLSVRYLKTAVAPLVISEK